MSLSSSSQSQSSLSQWNMENTLKLIEDFRDNPCLWDHTLTPLQKSRDRRLKIYNELAQKYSVCVNELVRKLHHLKFQFLRELKKLKEHEADENNEPSTWFGFTPLLFLLNQNYDEGNEISSLAYDTTDLEIKSSLDMLEAVDCSETDNNTKSISSQSQIVVDRTELDHNTKIISSQSQTVSRCEIDNSTKSNGSQPQTVTEKSYVKTEPIKLENGTLECMKSLIDVVNKHDEYSVYGDYIADKMRNCGRSQKEIHIAQHYINNVTYNLIMGVYGRGATITPSSTGAASTIPNFALKEEKM